MFKIQHLSPIEKKKLLPAYIFIIPWMIIFCIFYAYPLVYGIVISFFDKTLKYEVFNGLENYIEMFKDYRFWRSVAGMFRYAVIQLPLQCFIPLWIANVIKDHGRGFSNFTKVMIYLPGVLCSQALIQVWKFMFDSGTGLFTNLLQNLVGDPMFNVWEKPDFAIPLMALLCVFSGMGGNLIIYSAALNGISPDYYDAAELDGATRSQQFSKITIPLVKPTILYCLITGSIAALQIFMVPKLMTNGGPDYMTSTVLLMIYDSAFTQQRFGYASAMAVVLFIITTIMAVIQFRMNNSAEEY